tara:strand:+ start:48 stop:290 length:243 start_codon:yes stop_codon:yes gene_type:complete
MKLKIGDLLVDKYYNSIAIVMDVIFESNQNPDWSKFLVLYDGNLENIYGRKIRKYFTKISVVNEPVDYINHIQTNRRKNV